MLKRLIILASGLLLALSIAVPAGAQNGKTFYWVSHGSPTDPVWVTFLQGADQWAMDTGNTVNTSFHSGDAASQQDAVRAAIAANAAGIVTSVPQVGSLNEIVKEAQDKGIPIININTPDPEAGFDAYVGTNNVNVGRTWAQYLVDNKLVKEGDTVFAPVELLGQTYGNEETVGIKSVFDPLNIKVDTIETTLDQAEIITRMSDYMTANKGKINAMIGLGDLVTGSVQRVWDQVGIKAGEIPVVGWGNSAVTAQEIIDGYVNAAYWQDPQLTSYLGLSLAAAEASGFKAGGHSFIIGSLYEKDAAPSYLEKLTAK